MSFPTIKKTEYDLEYDDWYSAHIESPLIPVVRHLRNNGVNTTGSCAHENYIICVYHGVNPSDHVQFIQKALYEFGYKESFFYQYWNNGYWLIKFFIGDFS